MNQLIKLALIFCYFFFIQSIPAQEKQNRMIYLSLFNPYKSNTENGLSEKIYKGLADKLKSLNYDVVQTKSQKLKAKPCN